MASKKARLSETERFIKLCMKKKVFETFYRTTIRSGQKKGKCVGRISEKLGMASQ